jgi:dipeptidyl aminopeptidase/acylaminoacyl peptidase
MNVLPLAWRAGAVLALSAVQAAQAQLPAANRAPDELTREGMPHADAALEARLSDYLAARSATFLDWLPDGGMLIATRLGDTLEVHRVAAPLSMREQLTWAARPVSVAAVPPVAGADGFAFLEDPAGDARAQVYYYRLSDRSVRELTHGNARHGHLAWSRDGQHLAFFGTDRDGASYDIYTVDSTMSTAPRLIVAGHSTPWYPLDWSPDGQHLLLLEAHERDTGTLFIADVASGSTMPVDPSGKLTEVRTARFAPDGRGLYVVSSAGAEFAQLHRLDLVTHQTSDLTATIPWDVDEFDVSADGRYLAYVVDEDGRSRLTVLDTLQRLELAPPGLPDGVISTVRFDRTGRHLALSVESAQSPRDVYVYDLEHAAVVRWTHSEAGPLDPASFAPARLVHYPTWDRVAGAQRTIPAFVYSPRTAAPHPVLIDIHGGPDAQYRPGFDPFVQFLVNELGYVVIAPNVRGSAGYGRSFLQLDDGMLRTDALRDIGSLLVWIGLQPDLDRNRVLVSGEDYGGYLALASLAAYNDRLRGGIDVVGITDFVRYLQHMAPQSVELQRAEFGDERDPRMREYLERISPVANARAIRHPLLVVQGTDPGVPAPEVQQLVARVRQNGTDVWYLGARNADPQFREPADRLALCAAAAQFLQRWQRP